MDLLTDVPANTGPLPPKFLDLLELSHRITLMPQWMLVVISRGHTRGWKREKERAVSRAGVAS